MASAKKKKNSAKTKIITDPKVLREINELKGALRSVADAILQLRLYVVDGHKPTPEGLELLRAYVAQIDRVTGGGGVRGLGRP